MKIIATVLTLIALALHAAQAEPQQQTPTPTIENGSSVQIEYTLKDDAGTVLDSNKGRNPLAYTQGEHRIIPGLEKALNGMKAGDEKQVTVKPEDGYGEADPQAVTEVPKESIPSTALVVGTKLVARNQTGEARMVVVKEVREQTVVLDLNHPLAGKTLHFDVKILGVEAPKTPPPAK